MLDFAASMLAELERWMLTAGPAMIDLSTFADTSDKLMSSASVVEEVQKRLYTDEARAAPTCSNRMLRRSSISGTLQPAGSFMPEPAPHRR
jgi:hypothetical protein